MSVLLRQPRGFEGLRPPVLDEPFLPDGQAPSRELHRCPAILPSRSSPRCFSIADEVPGNEDEAAGLLDAYLDRANTAARTAQLA